MDILELGAIGELVGALAVVGSLLFVGLQMRQSNRLSRAESVQSHVYQRNADVLTPLLDQAFGDTLQRLPALPVPPGQRPRLGNSSSSGLPKGSVMDHINESS